jgi:outer membrane protein assembly factor BamB
LWFGGSTNEDILPRHGHGPQPQVVDGRLFIEGMDMLRATDIYTGRVLWETKLPGIGTLYDNTAHQPGANASGTNYIATPDGIYVAYHDACLVLDPVTGKEQTRFQLPAEDSQRAPLWGYLNVEGDYLVGGADPLFDPKLLKNSSKNRSSSSGDDDDDDKKPKNSLLEDAKALAAKVLKVENDNYSSSHKLVVMDRATGKVRWSAVARSGFRHNAICMGAGRLYCIDRLSGVQLSRLKRRGEEPDHKPRLVVFDLATGQELWSSEQDVFGTWLSYSAERDVLVEAGRTARDTLSDEPKGMRAYAARSGDVLWESKSYTGPAMIHHDTILMQGSACELLTGAKRMREHPLTGESVEWVWSRNYGCNTPMASEHLLTFRSGAAGYFDFCNDGGTGNFGGFRSSCTNNLVVAGGILSAPDYTRTCTCSYQNQTSLALVPMPDVETWTSFGSQTAKEPLRRVGINLAAPGDRKADDGTLWLEYPSVGGSSPGLSIKMVPEKPELFRRHSSQVESDGLAWVAASGAKGLRTVKIELADDDEPSRKYTVRLHFLEPDDVQPGERVFDVMLQGRLALAGVDVVAQAGGRNHGLVKEIAGVQAGEDLLIELISDPQAKHREAVLSGIEIQAEGW